MSSLLRCALHAHTTRSDGEREPEELIPEYEAAGFDVLAITDHWVRTEAEPTDGLLLIPSSELSCRLPDWPDTHAGEITAARLTIPPRVPYTRAEVVDRQGRHAWTNPLWP